MSLTKLDFYSKTLSMDQSLYVVLPDKGEGAPAEPLPPESGYPVLTPEFIRFRFLRCDRRLRCRHFLSG